MDRLIDRNATMSPGEFRLVDLVRAAEPVVVSDALQHRVLAEVLNRRRSRRWGGSLLVRQAAGLGILMLAGVTAAATIGHRWIEQKIHPVVIPMATVDLPPVAPRPRARHIAAPQVVAVDLEPLPALEHPGARPHARQARTEDPSRVVAAIQALRNDHDPARAARLLAEYLKVYPHGALSEEAVALSIEAAAARHSPSAATFANQYLRDYPNGRFRNTAEQALSRVQP